MNRQRNSVVTGGTIAVTIVVMSAEWILLVGGLKANEMLVGVASVVAATLFFTVVLRLRSFETNFLPRDVCKMWRIPWYILGNSLTLCDVLIQDLLGRQTAGSFYRVSGFRSSKTDPTLVARRVLATAYTTVSPNSIVIGIDYEQSRLLLHQVKRDEVARMTKDLGGQP